MDTILSWNLFDYILIAVVLLAAIQGLVRGFLAELIALFFWVAGLVLAFRFAGVASDLLKHTATTHRSAYFLAFAAIVVVVLLLGVIIRKIASLVDISSFLVVGRILGCALGVVRGALVALLIVFVMQVALQSQASWLKHSELTACAQPGVKYMEQLLPRHIRIAHHVSSKIRAA